MPDLVRQDRPRILHPMTSTTFGLEGYRVVQSLGVVMGITVRSRSVIGFIGAILARDARLPPRSR